MTNFRLSPNIHRCEPRPANPGLPRSRPCLLHATPPGSGLGVQPRIGSVLHDQPQRIPRARPHSRPRERIEDPPTHPPSVTALLTGSKSCVRVADHPDPTGPLAWLLLVSCAPPFADPSGSRRRVPFLLRTRFPRPTGAPRTPPHRRKRMGTWKPQSGSPPASLPPTHKTALPLTPGFLRVCNQRHGRRGWGGGFGLRRLFREGFHSPFPEPAGGFAASGGPALAPLRKGGMRTPSCVVGAGRLPYVVGAPRAFLGSPRVVP